MVGFDDAGPKRVKVKKSAAEEEEEEEPEAEPAAGEEGKVEGILFWQDYYQISNIFVRSFKPTISFI